MMSPILIALGLILGAIGLLWRWIERLGLGRLPGDVVIEHKKVCVLFSVRHRATDQRGLTLIFRLANR
ncbi:MAG TPA: DUF2905 family protein [Methylocella sp.]|jgi:hypothetical protein